MQQHKLINIIIITYVHHIIKYMNKQINIYDYQ